MKDGASVSSACKAPSIFVSMFVFFRLVLFRFSFLFSFIFFLIPYRGKSVMDLVFLLTKEIMWYYFIFFFFCFVVYQRTLVRYLIFLSKLKYTRKAWSKGCFFSFRILFCSSLYRYWNAYFYVPLQLEGHQPQFTQGSFNNVIFHKRICIKDEVLLWNMIYLSPFSFLVWKSRNFSHARYSRAFEILIVSFLH